MAEEDRAKEAPSGWTTQCGLPSRELRGVSLNDVRNESKTNDVPVPVPEKNTHMDISVMYTCLYTVNEAKLQL